MICWGRVGFLPAPTPRLWIVFRRSLSQKQISTALRPFYFLVHPDLLSRFPREKAVNETSLKSLQSHISEGKMSASPVSVSFYLKPRSREKTQLKSVKVSLQGDIRQTIISILETCNLPTSYVDSIPAEKQDVPSLKALEEMYPYYEDIKVVKTSREVHSTDVNQPLWLWLSRNVEIARSKFSKSEPLRLAMERRRDELCEKMGITEILWDSDSGWETGHQNGTLASFQNLCEHHFDAVKDVLKGRTIVFGNHGSGLSLDGRIILYSGEVRYNWLHVLRNLPEEELQLVQVPLVEKALSQALRGIQVVRRENQPLTLVDEHRSRVRKLVTNIGDFLARNSIPADWPASLEKLELSVETESCPLMLMPSGQFAVPASCPGWLLMKYIGDHMAEAEKRLASAIVNKREEESLIIRCINELGLIQLDRESSLDAETSVIVCCKRLLESAPSIRHLTHGNHLMVTRYYSVQSDGVICIPWNWCAEEGKDDPI